MAFGMCWCLHYGAWLRIEGEGFARHVGDWSDRTGRAAALIALVADHWLAAVGYVLLTFVAVGWLQIRGRPAWTQLLVAVLFCLPVLAYGKSCAYILLKLIVR
jgi:hypothetical protein